MADLQELLNIRTTLKIKKPDFLRQDTHKKKKLALKWRKPRGVDSKIRLNKRGYRKAPSKGYRSPKLIRNTLKGLIPVIVSNNLGLSQIKKGQIVVLSSSIGMKKKIEIVKEAQKLGLKIHNLKDPKKYLENTEALIKKRKETKTKKKQQKEKKKKEKEKKAAEKAAEKEPESEETKEKLESKIKKEEQDKEKKEKEKKELDKLLTTKKQ